ncbi:hypothetical protein DEU56DRAFT_817144 [Suillus clintonianus]|uniref:uncharacterized protein n=1 Tax=Suillus clintonianus TaxID=1904413 RepID=UPI001B885A20|nr:uncharacterized protein DEU56DRAFT_817144 [Suillus clintonianus]KAG2129443.1 hypothetical protein DEU56DRAFT_817144 [Suillus clintonianus]
MLVVGRVISGYSVGISSTVVPFGCSYMNGAASFRIPWGLQMIPAIVLSLGMLVFPESPRWLGQTRQGARQFF